MIPAIRTTLPIRTTLEDVTKVCKYLATKPTGATLMDAKNVIGAKYIDGRKLAALKRWRLITEDGNGRLSVTSQGRQLAKGDETAIQRTFSDIIRVIEPYRAIVERSHHNSVSSVTALDLAAYWHEAFPTEASDSDKILNDQAVCFFHVAEGAGLGRQVIGRKGAPTRFDFDPQAVARFVSAGDLRPSPRGRDLPQESAEVTDTEEVQPGGRSSDTGVDPRNDRVFISHGKNKAIVAQLKEIVQFGKFEPVVAVEHETPSKPVPDKVLDDMRSCFAGIIHVAGEEIVVSQDGEPKYKINENVLIEIGAAMALFGRNFILLVEKEVRLPSNLQGLYECRYEGQKLDGEATMKLLKAFNGFK